MTGKLAYLSPQSSADVPIADFSHLYVARDPRAYYIALAALEYQTPDHIQKLARQCLAYLSARQPDRIPWVVDVGCGYGTNGAGLLYDVSIQSLLRRYANPRMDTVAPDDVIEQDTLYFVLGKRKPYRIAGLDVSRNALDYGLSAGTLDLGFDDDLLSRDVPERLAEIVCSGALILESGVPIYVLPRILDKLLSVSKGGTKPWIISAPPRYTNVSVYSETVEAHGYVMEKVSKVPLPHRRFSSEEEGFRIMSQQEKMGLDVEREQTTGFIYVDLYLSRPREESEGKNRFTPVLTA